MKINISIRGRFHGFNLAQGLNERGHLGVIYSSYPLYFLRRYGLPDSTISNRPILEFTERALQKFPNIRANNNFLSTLVPSAFDRYVASRLENNFDLLVAWSSFAKDSILKAKKLGKVACLERGSTHIQWQTAKLQLEYGKFGLAFNKTNPAIIERELVEYQIADFICVPTNFVKSTFLDYGVPAEKLLVNPYGVDKKQFSYKPNKNPDKFIIMFCGGITFRKGAHYLVRAFNKLNLPDAELWLVGNLDPEFGNIFRDELSSKNIFFKGPYRQDDLSAIYNQCDIFCLPSLEEGQAMVLHQAMSSGLPLLATTESGAGDLIRGNGYLVKSRSEDDLASHLEYLYNNPKVVSEMGKKSLSQIHGEYSWDNYVDRAVTVYKSLLT